ncbi:hypothetical protein [Acetonema longum]|uniref:HEAT repeat domain-containing protein n=1 Tax=Acetonema longum DSM 6540 TaxID=1009370 RepID=F7ND99_9FIRM|nr:hypothetical protein [Acetonema longum]EGO65983.1 hypothetical protein ALO_00030 [Acetonema longum DSM 6540]
MLKSTGQDLQRRGFASEGDVAKLKPFPVSQLVALLHSDDPVTRTAAARCLSAVDAVVVAHLLEQLAMEKCLYTKIAICETLEKGDLSTARKMILYLGKIGRNQHYALPDRISAKKSYPLPRDIIARSLGKMNGSIFPALLDVLHGGDAERISEVLDSIGFMVFYHPEMATETHAQEIYRVFSVYEHSQLIVWKALLCLSAFPLPQSLSILQGFSAYNNVLGEEAKRSLHLISTRYS